MIAYRHDKWKTNVCFWDGHAETMDITQIGVNDNGKGGLVTTDPTYPNYLKYWLCDQP